MKKQNTNALVCVCVCMCEHDAWDQTTYGCCEQNAQEKNILLSFMHHVIFVKVKPDGKK